MPGRRQHQLVLDSVIIGLAGALSAQIFSFLLHWSSTLFMAVAHYQPPGMPNEGGVLMQFVGPYGLWLIPITTTIGGLMVGLISYKFLKEDEILGTDDIAIRAFHHDGGKLRVSVPFIKAITSAITIGSGSSAGREGPTAFLGAGFASIYANLFHRPPEERRFLILMGMAAGLAAIFRSPVGSAFFAIEVLYASMEFEAAALLYTMLAAIVAYSVNGIFVGFDPLFIVPAMDMPQFTDYFWYILLGLVAGVVAAAFPSIFFYTRDAFKAIPIPSYLKPALGGLLVGVMALWLPQIISGGYGWMQLAINGNLALTTLALLVVGKMIATSLTLASGGSGGIFAPGLFVGAMVGGTMASLFHLNSAAFVVVGMAAVFAGASHVPIATLLMVTELTGGYHLLVAAALAVSISYIVQVILTSRLKYKTLYDAQVPGREDSPAHHGDYLKAALHILRNHQISLSHEKESMDLERLLETGLPVDLSDNMQLRLARLEDDSPMSFQPVRQLVQELPEDLKNEVRVAAIVRDRHTLVPYGDLIMKPGDRVMIIAPPPAWKVLRRYFQFDHNHHMEDMDHDSSPQDA